MDLNSINCRSCDISAGNIKTISVSLSEVDVDEILSMMSIGDIVKYFDHDDLLDEIGESEAMSYFDLVKKEE